MAGEQDAGDDGGKMAAHHRDEQRGWSRPARRETLADDATTTANRRMRQVQMEPMTRDFFISAET
jgi:hypothetical protein